MIKVGSDFSGVGAFNQALRRLGVEYQEIFACDMDKYARQTFIHNYGEPKYYPTNVYDREIPSESLDIYMTSPPCQAFSLAGKRLGKDDKRGILFFNSLEFIQVNKPRYFIFENVKGLLSDDGGKTFSEWVNLLGGKSVNGLPVLFPYEDSVPYHLYWKVLNAKNHGVPQNRERVFLIGIRDDSDNTFRFPSEEHLTKRLKDVLEEEVDDKYFLSKKMIELITFGNKENGEIANLNKGGERGSIYSQDTDSISCLTATDFKQPKQIMVKSATSKGFEEATEGDSINFSVPNSETRRGRVGNGVAQTLDTGCNQGVMVGDYRSDEGFRWRQDGNSPAIMAMMRDTWKENFTGQNPPIINKDYKIRRLTPRECFRLMDFPDTFTWPVSDSQAYKQAGNSIVINVLYKILKNLLK
jgi:DNA (cytosine-5)-methyltransferase 1